ncbi:MAG: ABC transporter ATP-binding protein, partial [Anaerolineales bacterium]|nr:ABC transporter ATP-binding protein [Anaerolineales bacterium]
MSENHRPMLELDDVTKTFQVQTGILSTEKLTAVDKVSFTIHEGETVGLVGESGCGKSTVGRSILRLINIDSGAITFTGKSMQNLPEKSFRKLRKDIQMVFQNPLASFNPLFTIQQSLFDALALRPELKNKAQKRNQVKELLEMVQLPADFSEKRPHELSGGQLQRIALARALAPNPRFVFLDEPTSALDMSIRGQIVNLLLDLQQVYKISYLFVTHDLRVIYFVTDRVLVMYLGQIVETGTRDMIFHSPLHPYTHGLLAATLIGRDESGKVHHISRLKGEVTQSPDRLTGCKLYSRCGYA